MTTTINDDLIVGGAVSAANFTFGTITMAPWTNMVTSSSVAGMNLKGTGSTYVLLTAESPYPYTRVREVTSRFANETGFTAYIYRTDGADTNVHWLSIRGASV